MKADNNILIAKFMGMIEDPTGNDSGILINLKDDGYNEVVPIDSLRYDSDWNELLLAVEKCRINSNEQDSHWEMIFYSLGDIDIIATYEAVVNFILVYNKNK